MSDEAARHGSPAPVSRYNHTGAAAPMARRGCVTVTSGLTPTRTHGGIPVTSIEDAQDEAKAAGKSVTLKVYPDAPRDFHADDRPGSREIAEDS